MTAYKIRTWLVAGLLLTTTSTVALGQVNEWVNTPAHDLQLYSPVDFDFENLPNRQSSGYFFGYERLIWSFSGEKVTVGDKNVVVYSENILGTSPNSQGTPPPQYQITNGLQDVAPDGSDFGWGHRYEFGFFNGDNGWMVDILDGPKQTTGAIYGFQQIVIPNSLPLVSQGGDGDFVPGLSPLELAGGTLFGLGLVANGGGGSADLSTSRNGFGSVHVNFETAPGFLLGFRDYAINGVNNELGPTIAGPGRILFVSGVTSVEVNGVVTEIEITGATVITGADGNPDDLDGDGLAGFFFTGIDTDNDGVIDIVTGTGVDYDDLHLFNVRFDTFEVRNITDSSGIEIMKTHRLSNRHKMVNRQGSEMNIAYGVRYLRLRDSFYFEGRGDVLGRTFATTKARNSVVGPQIRAMWNKRHGRWKTEIDGRFTFGYNIQDQDQVGAIGEDLSPGGLNRPAAAQPTAFSHGAHEDSFSPLVELRAQTSYQATNSIALKLGYTAMFMDNITRASQTVRWYLPDMGLLKGGEQEIFINGIDFGFDIVY
jgi:hypothetical protein